MGATADIARWAAELTFDDIPDRIHARTRAQILSVVGAIGAGVHSEAAMTSLEVARTWSGAEESTVFATGERLSHLDAVFANACFSVAFDFDDYLFAGHTGHSAVCTALAYGELTGASGKDVLAAITVANEVGGRLGASLLLGPHNGQMWSYIHLLGAVCAAGRLLGLDAGRMQHAIGIAFTQPPYPLMPAFMGPDSKLLIPATPTVDGCKAAELAARGWTGAAAILEDPQGFLQKFNPDNLGWMLSGLGEAWVSDSLTYKVIPGCAYIDTAMDAFAEIQREHTLGPDDVERIDVRCGMFTSGMESFAQMYRSPDRLEPISVNFSVALSVGLALVNGAVTPQALSHKYLDAQRDEIEAAAGKVHLSHEPAMDAEASQAAEAGGFSLRTLLSGGPETGGNGPSLDGVSFEGYRMAFPAEVTVHTTDGSAHTASQDIPLGAAGRPWDETGALVRRKFTENTGRDVPTELDGLPDARDLVRALAP